MNDWVWLAIGVLASGPVWVGLTVLSINRVWRAARRLSGRAKGKEHLLELGHLAGGLAHEIKNPLSTINLNLRLLGEDMERFPNELHQRWLRRLEHVRTEAGRLKDILDDFLRYAGKIELSPQIADLRRLTEELVDFFNPQAQASRVIMRSSLSQTPVRCNVDAGLFKQALLNLMINAIQAMPEGGELLIRVQSAGRQGQIEVIDTGAGIPQEVLPKIFHAYYSTKPQGSGLGLPTSRRIINEHRGSIRTESEPGKGTRFIIRIPLADESPGKQ